MAVVVVDKDNFLDQAQGKEIPAERMDEKELMTARQGRRQAERADLTREQVAKAGHVPVELLEKEPPKAAKVPNETDIPDDDYALLTEKQQRAVNKKHRAMKEADEFAEEQYRERKVAERRAEEAERKLAERDAAGKPTPEAKEPDPKDFTTVVDGKQEFDAFGYAKALAAHAAAEAVKADRKEQDKLNKEAAEARSYQEYLGRVRSSAKGLEDWEEVAESAADMNVSGALTGYLRECEAPAPLLYHLAQHPDELERLNALPTIKAIREIAKLELSLTKEPKADKADEPDVKPTPRASEPITPLANGGGTVHKDPRDMSTRDHIEDEYRMAREQSRQRKRH
jgi:hypothetical protein